MNKRSTTLAVVLTILFALTGLRALAQSDAQSTGMDPETQAQVQQHLQQLSSELNLTDDQKQQLKPILQNEYQQLKSVSSDTTMSDDQKKAKAKELHQSAKSQIDGILTPDQRKKLDAMKASAQENY